MASEPKPRKSLGDALSQYSWFVYLGGGVVIYAALTVLKEYTPACLRLLNALAGWLERH